MILCINNIKVIYIYIIRRGTKYYNFLKYLLFLNSEFFEVLFIIII